MALSINLLGACDTRWPRNRCGLDSRKANSSLVQKELGSLFQENFAKKLLAKAPRPHYAYTEARLKVTQSSGVLVKCLLGRLSYNFGGQLGFYFSA